MTNKKDGTSKDIQHLSSALERFFLYKIKSAPAELHLSNYFELLIQSARTRLCIFQAPPDVCHYSAQEILPYIKATTFRTCHLYEEFVGKLTNKINQDRAAFLEDDCRVIQGEAGCLYIVLTRVSPEPHPISIGISRNRDAYERLDMLLRNLSEESQQWGINLEEALFNNFIKSSPKHTTHCLIQRDSNQDVKSLDEHPEQIEKCREELIKHLKDVYEWVESSYQRIQSMRLIETPDPEDTSRFIEHGNIFFFVRLNSSVSKEHCRKDCNNFEVQQIIPKLQKQHLSQYFHNARDTNCAWYQEGKCSIKSMGECVIQPFWQTAEGLHTEEAIYQHYLPLWEQLEQAMPAHQMKVAAAFHNNRIIFDRRMNIEGEGSIDYIRENCERDRISACLTHRIIPSPNVNSLPQEQTPQLMFSPIYSGTEAMLVVSSVVNTELKSDQGACLTEWRRSFRFGDYILGTLSNRFQEVARQTYLKEAAEIVFMSCSKGSFFFQERPSSGSRIDEESKLLNSINIKLDQLARVFSYKKITLDLRNNFVVKGDGHYNVFKTSWSEEWLVDLVENPYWSSEAGVCPLTAADVVEVFRQKMLEIIARRSLETYERTKFTHLYYIKFGVFPSADVLTNWKFHLKNINDESDTEEN